MTTLSMAHAAGWRSILKGLIGERTYEVANLLGNPWPHGELVHQTDRMLRLAEPVRITARSRSKARSRLRTLRMRACRRAGRWKTGAIRPTA